jgi:hypothetical protein
MSFTLLFLRQIMMIAFHPRHFDISRGGIFSGEGIYDAYCVPILPFWFMFHDVNISCVGNFAAKVLLQSISFFRAKY